MAYGRDEAVELARKDLAARLGVEEDDVRAESVALGAPVADEMSGMVISTGWRIRLSAGSGQPYEYRADRNQLRLYNFKGRNYRI